jgi:predicted  nucleic acid-binding Zn-ribbon protein
MDTHRKQAVQKLKSRIDRFNNDLAAFEAKAATVKESARGEFNATLSELREKRDEAQRKLGQLKDASDSAFDDMLQGIEKGWEKVTDSFDSARQRFH